MKQSAGVLLYHLPCLADRAKKRSKCCSSIPRAITIAARRGAFLKGLPDTGEPLEAAARRETVEETGVVAGELLPLGSVILKKSRKEGLTPSPAQRHQMRRQPPPVGKSIADSSRLPARQLLHPDQVPLLDRLFALLESRE